MELHCLVGIDSWHLNRLLLGNGRALLLVRLMPLLSLLLALFITIGYDVVICDRVLTSISILALERLEFLLHLYDRLLGALLAWHYWIYFCSFLKFVIMKGFLWLNSLNAVGRCFFGLVQIRLHPSTIRLHGLKGLICRPPHLQSLGRWYWLQAMWRRLDLLLKLREVVVLVDLMIEIQASAEPCMVRAIFARILLVLVHRFTSYLLAYPRHIRILYQFSLSIQSIFQVFAYLWALPRRLEAPRHVLRYLQLCLCFTIIVEICLLTCWFVQSFHFLLVLLEML